MPFDHIFTTRNSGFSHKENVAKLVPARKIRIFAASALLPLVLAACGESNELATQDNLEAKTLSEPQSTANGAPASDNIEATASLNDASSASATLSGKDQVGTNAAAIEVNKLTDTPSVSASTSTPTEKVDEVAAASQAPAASAPAAAPAPAAGQAPAASETVASTNDSTSTSAATVNSVSTIIDDMRLKNDAVLAGVDPSLGFAQGPGFNVMGNQPSGSNLPTWYSSAYPELASSGAWNNIIPWFVLFEGQGNVATNTRIHMRDLNVYILSRATNTWNLVIGEQDIDGDYCPSADTETACTPLSGKRAESEGGVSFKPQANNIFHGWFGSQTVIDGADVKAVFVTLQGRLALDNDGGTDDRAAAKYLFDVGADYAPDDDKGAPYLPGVGVSRAKLLTSQWQSFNFTTLSDVGVQDPGGGISQAELTSNPPPLQ